VIFTRGRVEIVALRQPYSAYLALSFENEQLFATRMMMTARVPAAKRVMSVVPSPSPWLRKIA